MPHQVAGTKRSHSVGHARKPKKSKQTVAAAEQLKLMTDAIDAVCTQNDAGSENPENPEKSSESFDAVSLISVHTQLVSMDKTFQQQREAIKTIHSKLDMILNFLGLQHSAHSYTGVDSSEHPSQPLSAPSSNIHHPGNSTSSLHFDGSENKSSDPSHSTSQPAVDVSSANTKVPSLRGALRQAVLSTVYVNQHIRDSRSNSIVIKGLDVVDNRSIKSVVAEFLSAELKIPTAGIVHCKQLGHASPGRVQPILTVLSNENEAISILIRAKELRKSNNKYVAEHIFIGPNLTASEAQAAYELRCRRRERGRRHHREQLQQRQQEEDMQHQPSDPLPEPTNGNGNANTPSHNLSSPLLSSVSTVDRRVLPPNTEQLSCYPSRSTLSYVSSPANPTDYSGPLGLVPPGSVAPLFAPIVATGSTDSI